MKHKVFIETHGCQMNVSDTERVSSRLLTSGFELVESESEADIVLLNTCSIREKASHKVFTRIGEIHQLNSKKPLIGVMGCVAQLEGANLFEKSTGVKVVGGTGALDRLPHLLNKAIETNKRQLDLGAGVDNDWDVEFTVRHSDYVAYVPIIEGCNKFCTYCIVPYSRGRERSRSASSIVNEVVELKARGVREICLIGQNVNSYRPASEDGLESFRGATSFSRLLRAVAATNVERIKFTTSFPRDFHEDIVRAMDENENLCEWVHLPVQSGSDKILREMRRGYTASFYMGLVEKIRNSPRRISLTTDLIVGFPSESDNDFEDTVKLARDCEYEGAYIFKYSSRQGTPAQLLKDTVPETTKTERFLYLERVQKEVQKKKYAGYVGRKLKVLLEKENDRLSGNLTGHSTCHKVVNVDAPTSILGRVMDVEILEAKANCLIGKRLDI